MRCDSLDERQQDAERLKEEKKREAEAALKVCVWVAFQLFHFDAGQPSAELQPLHANCFSNNSTV